MTWKFTVILILAIAPSGLARGDFWREIDIAGDASMPGRITADLVPWGNGCSLVGVKQVKRVIREKKNRRDGNLNGPRLTPSVVDLEYRIEEVYAGDETLRGRIVTSKAMRDQGRKFTAYPYYSECIPEDGDEGIWLVRLVDDKLVERKIAISNLTCISLEMLKVRFPVYSSGAHKRYQFGTKMPDYPVVLEFAEKVKQATEVADRPKAYWYELSKHRNELVSQWAAWELAQRYGETGLQELKNICASEEVYPMAQAIADDALLSLDKTWSTSKERQAMVTKWLTLKFPELGEVIGYYFEFYSPLPEDIQGYDRALLYEQMKQAISLHQSGTPEWKHLNRLSESLARESNDEP